MALLIHNSTNTLELFIEFSGRKPDSNTAWERSIISGALKSAVQSNGLLRQNTRVVVDIFENRAHLGSRLTADFARAFRIHVPDRYGRFIAVLFADLDGWDVESGDQEAEKKIQGRLVVAAKKAMDIGTDSDGLINTIVQCSMISCPPGSSVTAGLSPMVPVAHERHTPTYTAPYVMWNGISIPEFSPSWTQADWEKFLASPPSMDDTSSA